MFQYRTDNANMIAFRERDIEETIEHYLQKDLDLARQKIEKMERTELEESANESFEDIYHFFLLPAILIMMLSLLVIWENKIIAMILLFCIPITGNAGFFQPDWADHSNEAVDLYRKKKYKKSLELNKLALSSIKKEDPKNSKAIQKILFNLGMSQLRSGKVEEGIESLTKVSPTIDYWFWGGYVSINECQ